MLFGEIIKDTDLIPLRTDASDYRVSDIVCNSMKAKAQTVFVCLTGAKTDGQNYVGAAYQNGCRLFVVSHEVDLPNDAIIYHSKNTKIAFAHMSCAFFEHPADKLTIIGITGTKGKTTTSILASRMLSALGEKTGYIGSNGIEYLDRHYSTLNTTPDSYT